MKSAALLLEKFEGLDLSHLFRNLSRSQLETFLARSLDSKRDCLTAALLAGACCMYLGWRMGSRGKRDEFPAGELVCKESSATSSPIMSSRSLGTPYGRSESNASAFSSIDLDHCDNYRLALVIRSDLGMGIGKTASQCCRAFWGEVKKMQKKEDPNIYAWEKDGQTIVVYRVSSEDDIIQLRRDAKSAGVISHTMMDKGNNRQKTAMAIGPAKSDLVVSLTKNLQLL